jgi:hypothetical protein
MGKAHRLKSQRRKYAFFSTATTKGQSWLQRHVQTPDERNNNMEDPKQLRKVAKDFALEAYQNLLLAAVENIDK